MTPTTALPCPRCKLALETHSWHDGTSGECRRCGAEFEFMPFPALTAAAERVAPQTAVLAAESVCFFHAENRAEEVCDECGRMLCAVCAVPFMGRKLCPTCVAVASKPTTKSVVAVRDRILYDSIALSAAVLPLLIYIMTVVTAPVALGLAIYGWNKPGSLVHGRRRWRLILAGLIAAVEIVAWIFVFTKLSAFLKARGAAHH